MVSKRKIDWERWKKKYSNEETVKKFKRLYEEIKA